MNVRSYDVAARAHKASYLEIYKVSIWSIASGFSRKLTASTDLTNSASYLGSPEDGSRRSSVHRATVSDPLVAPSRETTGIPAVSDQCRYK